MMIMNQTGGFVGKVQGMGNRDSRDLQRPRAILALSPIFSPTPRSGKSLPLPPKPAHTCICLHIRTCKCLCIQQRGWLGKCHCKAQTIEASQ
jgi:hypothetical protein